MRKLFLITVFLIASMMLLAPVASAQTTISDGCIANASASGVVPDTITADFATDEVIMVSVTSGDGGLFDVTIAGNLLLDDAPTGSTTDHTVVADGTVTINITVTGGTGTYAISCTAPDESDVFDGTLCHYPPGNPDAAHTITVGSENAVETHISKHGDTLGACPDGVQTRADLPDINITIFIIFASDSIQIFGECTDVCEEVMNTPIILIIDLDLVIINIGGDDSDDDGMDDDDSSDGDVFMQVDNPEDYGFILDEVSTDGLFIIIYFLHPHPDDASIGVFQINVMDSGTLLDDSILLFINTDGEIVRWTDHGVWDEG